MPLNGNGTFSRLYDWTDDRDANVKIRADRMDSEMDGFATALSTALYKDGQQASTANQPMGGFKHTNVANATARNHYSAVGQVQDSSFTWCSTAGGSKNALTFTPTPAITAYAEGQSFVGIIGGTSSDDATTLAVSGLTAKAVQIDGSALSATVFLETGKMYRFDYDGTQFQATRLSQGATQSASVTVAGIIEVATAAETNTGTDAARAVSPDGLAGSNYGTSVFQLLIFDDETDCATGNGAGDIFLRIPSTLNGFDLVAVAASCQTAGTTGTMDIQIHNVTDTADMLSTVITIDSGETDSSTAAAAAVIDTDNDDVATGDQIRIDVDAVHTTAALGLLVELQFRRP